MQLEPNCGTLKLAETPCLHVYFLPQQFWAIRLGTDRSSYFQPKKWDVETQKKVTLSQQPCFPTTAGQLSLPNMAAFGGIKNSRVFVASGIKHAWTWSDQFFSNFNLTDGGSLVPRKDSREVTQLTQKKPLDFSDDLDAIKRTISAKRVSSKTLETPFDLSQKSPRNLKK